jgi:hypothetical protein
MREKCSNPGCPAPKGLCLESMTNEHLKCDHWFDTNSSVQAVEASKSKNKSKCLPWTGEALQPDDISIISERSAPLIVGMIGTADSGKTSYLGMLYTLLFNGAVINNWNFAGCTTLSAWETLAQFLKIKHDGSIKFPIPTPSHPEFYSLYHLALKNKKIFRDVLFADSSGEVFTTWSEDINDVSAENARWIYKNSSAFIFMVDSFALSVRRGQAKSEIVQMAEQLAANLNGRPVTIVWTKSDKAKEIGANIKTSLEEDLLDLFPRATSIQVSNFPKNKQDKLCYVNNLNVIEDILNQLNQPSRPSVDICLEPTNDHFLDYKGLNYE